MHLPQYPNPRVSSSNLALSNTAFFGPGHETRFTTGRSPRGAANGASGVAARGVGSGRAEAELRSFRSRSTSWQKLKGVK
jgi:hypothetical protein